MPLIARRLQQVVRRPAITCTQEAPIRDALVVLRREGIGSMLVLAPSGVPVGIFTLRDLLAKVVLAGRSIADPISTVMTHDPITLPTNAFALDAALAMARHGVHHIVVADGASIAGGDRKRTCPRFSSWGCRKSATRCARQPVCRQSSPVPGNPRCRRQHTQAGGGAEPDADRVHAERRSKPADHRRRTGRGRPRSGQFLLDLAWQRRAARAGSVRHRSGQRHHFRSR